MGRKINSEVGALDRVPTNHFRTAKGALTVVLLNPRIPQNTGSIARLCAATGSRLHLINPLFKITEKKLRRAGLDYWPLLDVLTFDSYKEWQAKHLDIKPWLVECKAPKAYSQAEFKASDYIMFGDEQAGIDEKLLSENPELHIDLPQINVRSINLAMATGVVLFEAYRQLNYPYL